MPRVYQAYYNSSGKKFRHHSASRTKILAEARTVARETGQEVKIDILEMESPSMKYLIDLLNGATPKSRERMCSFVPRGSPILVTKNGVVRKLWKVKKQKV